MPCKQFQTALTDAAASGAPSPELRQHLTTCSSCQAAFVAEQNLFASIDSTLQAQVNAEIPSAFVSRAQARIKEERQPYGKYSWISTWAFAAVSAAVLLAFVFPLLKSKPRQPTPTPAIIAQTPDNPVIAGPGNARNIRNASATVSRVAAPAKSTLPKLTSRPSVHKPDIPEILVAPGEARAFAGFVAALQRNKALIGAVSPVPRDEGPLQLSRIEIAAVHVDALNPQTEFTDFLGRPFETR